VRKQRTTDRVGLAVVGLGHQARKSLLPAVSQVPAFELLAGVDPLEDARSWFASTYDAAAFDSIDALLVSGLPVDCVLIAVPHHLHLGLTRKAMNAGLTVLKEKPYALTVEEARSLRSLEETTGRRIETLVQRRMHHAYQALEYLLADLGEISYISMTYDLHIEEPLAGWRGQVEQSGGGAIMDMGYHMIDLLLWYFGLPHEISAITFCDRGCAVCEHPEVEAQIHFGYGTASGVLAMSRVASQKREIIVAVGDQGRLDLTNGVLTYRPRGRPIRTFGKTWSWEVAMVTHLNRVANALSNKERAEPPDHVSHLAFIEAAYKSISVGAPVDPRTILAAAT
jgi:predicted dehydrogenase